ncbi:sodium/hydrogen exchanger 3 [Phytophthora nicotianae P10297]|uniref:Sodium/hydrogen exchanger n=2 Tax=Phytophthora nicotianae TaxID=4792 RepID=W2ZF00_PHYNI|nr:sodium/hydrogen exchanger 3 [Phytophthora nicotianae]ETP45878.1 sodium/hydrogen exchanger 3 [Phytophthora nicotianae P10297]
MTSSYDEHIIEEINEEYSVAFQFATFLLLLMIAIILCNHVTHKLHWHFLPEAAATIGVGILASIFCMLMNSSTIAVQLMDFDPNFFFVGMLPPIIFNSGYTMKRRYFFENITPILVYSILGTLIMSVVTGISIYTVGRFGWVLRLSMAEALTFGSLISATDAVSILAVFQELHVDPTLFYLVFGESSLNDAVAICLFETFSRFIGHSYEFKPMLFAIFEFGLVLTGSTMIGVIFGMIPALLFKYGNLRSNLLHEVGVFVMFAYIPFVVSEVLGMSGVVSVIFAGVSMKHYASPNLTPEARDVCSGVFNTLSHMAETSVFLNLGLSAFGLTEYYRFWLIVWMATFCLFSRGCAVYSLSYVLNLRKNASKITLNQQHVIWYGGMRGAVAFALSKSFPGEKRPEIVATTLIVVLLSIIIMGGGTVAVLDKCGIPRLTAEEEAALDKTVKPHRHMRALQFDNKYLIPLLTNLCQYGDNSSPRKGGFGHGNLSNVNTADEHDSAGAEDDEVVDVIRREVNVH